MAIKINGNTVIANDQQIYINNTGPTIYFQDSDSRSSMIHCNSNIFYILRGSAVNSTTWAQYNGQWPLMISLENNNATFGGNVEAITDVRAPIFYDSNNTAYYCDPASGERIYSSTIGGYGASTANGDGSGQLQIINGGGSGDSNVAAIAFHCSGAYAAKLHLRADGYFGYGGWSAGSWLWYVNGSGNMTAAGSITANSDPRLKEDIKLIDSALNKILSIGGYKFKWKSIESVVGSPGTYDYGVLSTEIETIAPELVIDSAHESTDGDKYKTVAYDKLIPFLIEAIKEQQTIINDQKSQLEEQNNRLTILENQFITL